MQQGFSVAIADKIIDGLGLTALVDEHEELAGHAHVYNLVNGATMVVTSENTRAHFDAWRWSSIDANAILIDLGLTIARYEKVADDHVYTLA